MERHRIFESTEKRIDRNITFCFIVRETSDSFLYTDIFCLPVCLWLSASVFVSPSSEKFFVRSGTAALPWKSSVNWWSCCSESAAFKSTEHSPLRPSNAFTWISPIYKAYAHLQTHSHHPLQSNTGQWRVEELESRGRI